MPKCLKTIARYRYFQLSLKYLKNHVYQLHDYFQDNKLYCKNQYGFRRNHSTEYAALELIDRVILDMDKSEIPFSIFIDLSKAFDTLDHIILMNKLQYYGIKDTTLDLFQNYLSNRRQYISMSKMVIINPIQLQLLQVCHRHQYLDRNSSLYK